jgi:group I intron endonuclease
MLIYKITNLINKKVYIGQTVQSLKKRKNKHLSELRNKKRPNSHLTLSFHKFGENSFIFETIESCNSLSELSEREKFWIKHYKSNDKNFGYNETEGGTGTAGLNKAILKEMGLKVSKSLKGRKLSKEHSKKIGLAQKGKIISLEQRKKISETLKRKYKSGELISKPSYVRGNKHGMYGKTHTKEARKKISEARTGKTYEELFGLEKAKELKEKKKLNTGAKNPFYKNVDLNFVIDKLKEGFYLKDISKMLSVARRTILYKFKKEYGITLQQYIDSIK